MDNETAKRLAIYRAFTAKFPSFGITACAFDEMTHFRLGYLPTQKEETIKEQIDRIINEVKQ